MNIPHKYIQSLFVVYWFFKNYTVIFSFWENQVIQELKIANLLTIDWLLLSQSTPFTKVQAEDRARLVIGNLGTAEGMKVTLSSDKNTLWTEENCYRLFPPHLLQNSGFVFSHIMYPNISSKIKGDLLFGQWELTPLLKLLPSATDIFGCNQNFNADL